jgi:SAM-dependent methyltransferase
VALTVTKPEHLSKQYGDQFSDPSIVEHYHYRPAYSEEVIIYLSQCQGDSPIRILDVGCGTGEISIPLSQLGHTVVGLDPSAEMIKAARLKSAHVEFVNAYVEDFSDTKPFDLIIAANSIHWADWPRAFKVLKALAHKDTRLAIVTGGDLVVGPIQEKTLALIKTYSTNTGFKSYSVVDMLVEQNYLQTPIIKKFRAKTIQQPVDHFIASFHARNGFSLDRMTPDNAKKFDAELKQILLAAGFGLNVQGQVNYSVALGAIG